MRPHLIEGLRALKRDILDAPGLEGNAGIAERWLRQERVKVIDEAIDALNDSLCAEVRRLGT